MDELIMTLTAVTEACEGRLELHTRGIDRITTDEELNLAIHMEDGRQLGVEQLEKRVLEDAIFDWRQQHPAFFQRIIGAMM